MLRHTPALLLLLLRAVGSWGHDPCCAVDNVYVMEEQACLHKQPGEDGLLLNCSGEDIFLMDPINNPSDKFHVTDEGHLNLEIQREHIASSGKFCLTRLLREDGNRTAAPGEEDIVALVCFPQEELEDTSHFRTYAVCLCVSVVFLLATLVVYLALPQLRDLQGKTVMCAVASLCLGELWLAVAQFYGSAFSSLVSCIAVAFLMYFWMMSAFFWMNVVSFNLWRCVIFPNPHADECKLFTYYCIYGWGGPMVFLTVGLITEHVPGDHVRPNFGQGSCWFDGSVETWSYFYGPMAVLLVCNIVFFVWTSWRLWKDYRNTSMPKLRAMRFKCLLYLKLFIIMGISWVFELLSFMFESDSGFWIVTDIINALQGLFIFVVVVLRKRVLQALVHSRICGLPWPKRWAAGVDEESETMLAEEMQLGSNANN